MTPAQRRALDALWPKYGVDVGMGVVDVDAVFGRHAPTMVEVGFGDGVGLLSLAAAHPENNYLGIEVHRPGVGRVLLRLRELGLGNVRVICADAAAVLANNIPDDSLGAVYIFFPDPWPKKRHHKRRLLQQAFIHMLGRKLKRGGCLHVATDWRDYAEHILIVMSRAPEFRNTAGEGLYSPRPDYRPLTKYEQRGRRLGHEVYDLIFERCGD